MNITLDGYNVGRYQKIGSAEPELQYFYNDHLGSRVAVTDSGGNVLSGVSYTIWGVATATAVDTTYAYANSDVSFTGKELDATGLYYFNARFYDASIGRFLSEDPKKDGMNWYAYCGNNPTSNVDPDGMADHKLFKGYCVINWTDHVIYAICDDNGGKVEALKPGAITKANVDWDFIVDGAKVTKIGVGVAVVTKTGKVKGSTNRAATDEEKKEQLERLQTFLDTEKMKAENQDKAKNQNDPSDKEVTSTGTKDSNTGNTTDSQKTKEESK
jgi:RHS repeat-associated protein